MAEPRLVSNKWEIIRVIGHGGMGSVYEVRHTTLEIRRALKTLHRHLADDPDIVRRFLREGRNEARLDHPNIVRVYDFDTDPEFGAYLTMELVEGWDVKQLMQQGAIPFHEVVRIGCEVAAALDYAHGAIPPVVHRDIKPANILISTATGLAKVTDFGIAKELAERETGVTGTQGFIGTIRYAAPEQVRDDVKIDARCDLYSLGVMLYEMYSGHIFLDGEKPADIYRRTMVEPDWQPSMVYSSPPPDEFAEVLRWCLQRRREDRVPSARELLKCLRLCAATVADHGHDQRAISGGEALIVSPDLAARPAPLAETSVTAATVVALRVDEDATTIVGLRAKISRFRQDLNAEADAFGTLSAEAAALGLPMDGLPAPDDLSSQLAELDEEVDAAGDSRDRERLAHAFSRCERVGEEFAAGTTEVRRRLAAGVAATLGELRSAWRGVVDGGGAVSPEAREAFAALLETGQARAEAADWASARTALQQARVAVDTTRAALTQQAQTTIDELLQQGAALATELARYLAADATPDVDVAAVQQAAATDLAAGRIDAAIARARNVVEQAQRALERGRLEAQTLLQRQRRAADDALHSLEPESAEGVAPDEYHRAGAALESARAAERQDQVAVAAARYGEAAELLAQVRTRIAEQHAARLGTLEARIDELLQDAARQPDAVTGPARKRVEVLLREHAKGGGAVAIEALEGACQLLEDARAEVPEYLAAQEAMEGARVAEHRVRELAPSAAQLEAVTRQHAGANAALADRRWREAATICREAERAWRELEQELREEREAVAREQQRRLAEMRQALERTLQEVAGAPPDVVADARRAAETALAAPTTDAREALALWHAAHTALVTAQQAVPAFLAAQEQQQRAAAAQIRVEALRPRPAHAPLKVAQALAKAAAAAAQRRDWAAMREGYAKAADAFGRLELATLESPVQPSRWLRRLSVAGLVALVAVAAVWQVLSRTKPAPSPPPTTPAEQRAESNVAPQLPSIEVKNVNRPPVLLNVVPDPNTAVDSKVGDSVLFKAEATDADKDDRLTYRWTVDGKPAGTDAPQLSVKVASNHAVGVSVSDGTDHADATWRIAAVAPLVFDFSPKQLDTVPFKSTATFKLIPPRDLSLADVSFTWTLDGRTVSDGPAFTLETSDPAWVRATPLKLTATATDQQGGGFSHAWKVTVVPPAPEIQSATPPADKPIDAESGQSLTFQVAAAPPVGNQKLTYLFALDDQPVERSGQPQFELRVADESAHRVSARVEDNYRQASKQTVTWQVQGSDILSQARKWVATFQEARQNRDAQKEGQLRDLSATEINRLQDAYSKQKDLQVSFTALQIDKLAGNRARAVFTMTQSFAAPNGERISGRLACELTLTRTDGRLRADRRAQGPCVPVP